MATKGQDELNQIACHECDLLVTYPKLEMGESVVCPRCDYVLTKRHKNAMNRLIALSLSGLVFLLMSSLYPFLSFSASGQGRVITLLQGIDVLADEQQLLLASMILLMVLILPAIFLSCVVYVMLHLKYHAKLPRYGQPILRFILNVGPWNMVEIFLIGTLVSIVKISSMALITIGLSFWSYIAFTILMTTVLLHLDKVQIWSWVEERQNAG